MSAGNFTQSWCCFIANCRNPTELHCCRYGLDALAYDEIDSPEAITLRKWRFKETKLKLMAEIDRNHPGKIKKDRQGKIIYDEKVHGEDVLILVRVDKATGREIEPVNSTREQASMQ